MINLKTFNRVVLNKNDSIMQVNHYYPFGTLFGESTNGGLQKYKYNGKELERMYELDLYDYGARWMDPVLGGRFTSIDPLCNYLSKFSDEERIRFYRSFFENYGS